MRTLRRLDLRVLSRLNLLLISLKLLRMALLSNLLCCHLMTIRTFNGFLHIVRLGYRHFDNELLRVMVHGLLHLMGYGDKTEEDTRIMREKEDCYIAVFLG